MYASLEYREVHAVEHSITWTQLKLSSECMYDNWGPTNILSTIHKVDRLRTAEVWPVVLSFLTSILR